jgi:HNH endonuclease
MNLTPSQVKNLMRRGMRLLVDPEPESDQRQRTIAFFGNCCAYCGSSIEKGQVDLDHLLSAAKGGRNHISNRVFSCKRCNAEQKRDMGWEEFLLKKCGEGPLWERRRRKILDWINSAGAIPPLTDETLRLLEEEGRRVTAAYDKACRRLRSV